MVHPTSSYQLLLESPSSGVVSTYHLTHLTNTISKTSREKAIQLRELVTNSIDTSNRLLTFELQQTIRLIQFVQSEIDTLHKQIKPVVDE